MAEKTPNDAGPPRPEPTWIDELRQGLLGFFQRTREARRMPWRETDDPYAIWVSEIMLQQTRVETVIPYWEAWMARFPTVEALARAPEAEVLKRWEGLGYYSRARNLHKAAAVVRERHGGELPADVEALRKLPGIGPYTAGAVGSIAFGIPAPAVDGNVRRVVARLLDWPDPSSRELEEMATAWVPGERPGDFNQALMELGATVCTPRSPSCEACPVAELCRAHSAGTEAERPVRKRKARVRKEVHAVVVAASLDPDLRLALRKRPASGLLAGLWEFPGEVVPDGDGEAAARGLPLWNSTEGASGPVLEQSALPEVRHAFTHLHVTYRPVLTVLSGDAPAPAGATWLSVDEIRALPLPVAQQSIVEAALEALNARDY